MEAKKNMTTTQIQYFAAKASHAVIAANDDSSDAGLELFCDSLDALKTAERAMIAEVAEIMKTDKRVATKYSQIATCFAKPIANPKLNAELVKLCSMLNGAA
jgi:hypothetical protein